MIEIKAGSSTGSELEKEVDTDLEEFSEWLKKRFDQSLVRSERAILKTYLWYKTKGKDAPPNEPDPVEGAAHGT